jgi:hypothetical protein
MKKKRSKKKKYSAKIFCNGMRKRPKKVVSARNCFPFKVDHKTYVDKLSQVLLYVVCCVLCVLALLLVLLIVFIVDCLFFFFDCFSQKKVTSYVTVSFLLSFFSLRSLPSSHIPFWTSSKKKVFLQIANNKKNAPIKQ